VRGRVRIVPPPDHLHGDRRGVLQPPEDDTVAPVLRRGAFGGDPDAAAGRVNPVFAALTGLVVLGQSLAPADWLAVAVIVTVNAVSVSSGSGGSGGSQVARERDGVPRSAADGSE
jgi:hypothetical protein